MLLESKRFHDHCDDSWYCCDACTHPDHSEGVGHKEKICNCGASRWNLRVDRALSLNQKNISCPDCCNGTIITKDTGDPDTSEYGQCTTCLGDSRQ